MEWLLDPEKPIRGLDFHEEVVLHVGVLHLNDIADLDFAPDLWPSHDLTVPPVQELLRGPETVRFAVDFVKSFRRAPRI